MLRICVLLSISIIAAVEPVRAAVLTPRQIAPSFQAGTGGWHLGTLAVGNLDADAQLEIVVPYRDSSSGHWHLDAFDFSGTRIAGFPYSSGPEEMNVSPTLADLDGDGRDEIFITRGNNVVALRGDGTVLWSTRIDYSNYVPNGGYQIVPNGFWWSAGPIFLDRLPSTAVFSSQVSSPIVADVNADGRPEVLTAWKIKPDPASSSQDFNPFINDIYGSAEWGTASESWSGGVVFMNAQTGGKEFVYHIHQLVESGLAIGQADDDRPSETYVLNDSDSIVCFDRSRPHGLWGKGMLHKQFGKNQRLMTGSYHVPQDIYTTDLDGDGPGEVLVPGTRLSYLWTPNETILDDDGTILWRKWKDSMTISNVHGWLNSASFIPVNPERDNRIDVFGFNHSHELTFRSWDGIELVDRPGWPKDFSPHLPSPPVVGDVDGDGAEEIIVATYNPANNPSDGGLSFFTLDGQLRHFINVPGGVKHIPSLADVNGDGSIDLIVRSLFGRLYVYNFGAIGPSRISWATHRGNKQRDGNAGVNLFPAGTPIVTRKTCGSRQVSFSWSNSIPAQGYWIYRAEHAYGPFVHLATLPATAGSFVDSGVQNGWQYFYEVAALYATGEVRSAPFPMLPLVNSNVLANAGFEENDNSRWDKWYTGQIEMTNMLGSTIAYQGRRSMEIRLQNKGNNSSIAQFNQYGIPDSTVGVRPGGFYSFGGYFKSGGISQPSEHWLEWSSTKTANDTNNRPSLPWPNYFTPHFKIDAGATDWIYANRVFTMPAGFPNIELRHRYTIGAAGSGSIYIDNVFFRSLPQPDSAQWRVLVPFNGEWHYWTETPAANWQAANFDDSRWPIGIAKFGAGDGPDNVITRVPKYQPQYCFRQTFWHEGGDLDELLLAATCTDDYAGVILPLKVYINGVELGSSGIEAVSGHGNEVRYFDLHPFVHLLRPGLNSIAVMVRNTWVASWDDVAFDISLRAVPRNVSGTSLRMTRIDAAGVHLSVQTPVGSQWKLQSCDRLNGAWQTIETFISAGVPQIFVDVGQGGSLSRFYRLVPY